MVTTPSKEMCMKRICKILSFIGPQNCELGYAPNLEHPNPRRHAMLYRPNRLKICLVKRHWTKSFHGSYCELCWTAYFISGLTQRMFSQFPFGVLALLNRCTEKFDDTATAWRNMVANYDRNEQSWISFYLSERNLWYSAWHSPVWMLFHEKISAPKEICLIFSYSMSEKLRLPTKRDHYKRLFWGLAALISIYTREQNGELLVDGSTLQKWPLRNDRMLMQ